jgi:hypothetical protein
MRRVIALACLLLTSACLSAVAASTTSVFTEANAKYRQGDFKEAAALYQKMVQTGNASGAVYYNLGNANMRLGQKGEALLFYERALKIVPRDKDLRWNVQVLRGALTDRIEDNTSNALLTPIERLLEQVTLDEVTLAFSAGLALLALFGFAAIFAPAARGALRPVRSLALLCVLLSALAFAGKWSLGKDPVAVVLDPEVTAYYGPSDKETKAFVLHEGAEGKVLDESSDWLYLSLKNKNTGWIRKNSCEIV